MEELQNIILKMYPLFQAIPRHLSFMSTHVWGGGGKDIEIPRASFVPLWILGMLAAQNEMSFQVLSSGFLLIQRKYFLS